MRLANPFRHRETAAFADRDAVIAESERLRRRHFAMRAQAGARVARRNLLLGIVLVAAKIAAAWTTGSVAIAASAVFSIGEASRAAVLHHVARLALAPPNADHRFGYGKGEALIGLGQVFVMALMVVVLAALGIRAMGPSGVPAHPVVGIGVSLAATAIGWTLHLLADGARRTRAALATVAGLTAVNGVAATGLWLDPTRVADADPLAAAIIGIWLCWTTARFARDAVDQLMDREWPEAERQRLLDLLTRHPAIVGVHDLRTRIGGRRYFAQLHLVVPPEMPLGEADAVVRAMTESAKTAFPFLELFVHIDPAGAVDRPGDPLVEADVVPRWVREGARPTET